MIRFVPLLAAALLLVGGCSTCGDEPQPSASPTAPSAGDPTGAGISDAWLEVSLGGDREALLADLVRVLGFDEEWARAAFVCRDRAELAAVDLRSGHIAERPATDAVLEGCTLRVGNAGASSPIVEARGELLDGRLVQLGWRFAPGRRQELVGLLDSRLGAGEQQRLEVRTGPAVDEAEFRVWQRDGEVWLLGSGVAGTEMLTRYDTGVTSRLASPPPPAVRGKPVSLEDLGIGALDLNAPLPEVDIPSLDAAPAEDAGSGSTP